MFKVTVYKEGELIRSWMFKSFTKARRQAFLYKQMGYHTTITQEEK